MVIKAAAVADYRTKAPSHQKIKGKHDLTLELTANPDILKEVAATARQAFIVGFAAETHDVAANARAKLDAKGVDLLVVNDVSQQGIGLVLRGDSDRPQPRVDAVRQREIDAAVAAAERQCGLADAARQRV